METTQQSSSQGPSSLVLGVHATHNLITGGLLCQILRGSTSTRVPGVALL